MKLVSIRQQDLNLRHHLYVCCQRKSTNVRMWVVTATSFETDLCGHKAAEMSLLLYCRRKETLRASLKLQRRLSIKTGDPWCVPQLGHKPGSDGPWLGCLVEDVWWSNTRNTPTTSGVSLMGRQSRFWQQTESQGKSLRKAEGSSRDQGSTHLISSS